MIHYKTRILKETAAKPTKLDFERILYQRTKHPIRNNYYSLKNKERGALGEKIVIDYLEEYGKEDWVVIQNIWLNYDGPFEGDIILLTNHRPYLFEVKNYNSDYTYENGTSTWNNNAHSGNPVNQTNRNATNLQKSLRNLSGEMTVRGVLALVGIDSKVEIKSAIPDIDIITRFELRKYIQNIVKEEVRYRGTPINKKSIIKSLERHEIPSLQMPKPLTNYEVNQLHKGIYCLNCKSFNAKIGNRYISCECGATEKREIATLRTICEYGVLTFNRNLKIGPLANFFGKDISKNSLRKVLKKYFVEESKGRNSCYIVRKLPLEKLYREFNIDPLINLKLKYQEYDKMREEFNYMIYKHDNY